MQKNQTNSSKQYNILYFPINASGHINGSHGLVERIVKLISCKVIVVTTSQLVTSSNAANKKEYEYITLDPNINDDKYKAEYCYDWKDNEFSEQFNKLIDRVSSMGPLQNCLETLKILHSGREIACLSDVFTKLIKDKAIDLIITDSYATHPGITKQTSVPWISFLSCSPLPIFKPVLKNKAAPLMFMGAPIYTKTEREDMRKNDPLKWQALMKTWIDDRANLLKEFPPSMSDYNRYAKAHNAPLIEIDHLSQCSPFMNVYMYPKEMDFTIDDDILEKPSAWINCETTLSGQLISGSNDVKGSSSWSDMVKQLRKKEIGKVLVYFSLGSLASSNVTLMQRLIDIFARDKDRAYIVSKGCNGDKLKLNESNMIGANYVPQNEILELVDFAIIHGGNNSFIECVYHTVPAIVMPTCVDQFDNAQRVEDLKLGRRLNPFKCTYEEVMNALTELGCDRIVSGIRKIGVNMKIRDECGKVAKLAVEKLVEFYNNKKS